MALTHGRLFKLHWLPATTIMVSLAPHLESLAKAIFVRPVDALTLDSLVQKVLNDTSHKVSAENRKSQWEYLLKNEIFALAVSIASLLSKHS